MAEDKVSRREFLSKTTMAASTVVAGSAAGAADEQAEGAHEHLVEVLTRKNIVDPESMDAVLDFYENKVGPHIGANIVARSWVDADFRERLLEDARAVLRDEGLVGVQGTDLVAVENSEKVHNLVVCTLCSCYPWPVLGLPPSWYKDTAYRAQAVIDPRGVLKRFGLELDDDVEVRVWDSTAEVRYLVIPERPPGTDGMDVARWSRPLRGA